MLGSVNQSKYLCIPDEGISGGGGVDVDVRVEESLEHWSSFAGLDVEHHLAVRVGGVHRVDGLK